MTGISIIIGGTSRSGKTTLAARIAKDFGLNRIHGDGLISGFGKAFPELGIRHEQDALVTARKFGPFLNGMFEQITKRGGYSFVLDSFHIMPSSLALGPFDGKIRSLYLGYPEANVGTWASHFRSSPEAAGWMSNLKSDEDLEKALMGMVAFSHKVEEECKTYGLPFFDVSRGWDTATEAAYKTVKSWLDQTSPVPKSGAPSP